MILCLIPCCPVHGSYIVYTPSLSPFWKVSSSSSYIHSFFTHFSFSNYVSLFPDPDKMTKLQAVNHYQFCHVSSPLWQTCHCHLHHLSPRTLFTGRSVPPHPSMQLTKLKPKLWDKNTIFLFSFLFFIFKNFLYNFYNNVIHTKIS